MFSSWKILSLVVPATLLRTLSKEVEQTTLAREQKKGVRVHASLKQKILSLSGRKTPKIRLTGTIVSCGLRLSLIFSADIQSVKDEGNKKAGNRRYGAKWTNFRCTAEADGKRNLSSFRRAKL